MESPDDTTSALQEYAAFYELAPVGYLTLDREGAVTALNLTCARLLEMERSHLIGRRFEHLVTRNTRPAFLAMLAGTSGTKEKGICEVALQGNAVEPLFVRLEATQSRAGGGHRIAIVDISERRRSEEALRLSEARYQLDIKQAQENISFLANYDPLTNLLNRNALRANIRHLLSMAQEAKRSVALLIINIDGFKQINASTKQGVGDELLRLIARRLSDSTRSCDVVVRLGMDEFAVVLWDSGMAEASVLGEQLVSSDFTVQGTLLTVTTSIGISVYPNDSGDCVALLKYADIAMRHAKQSGGRDFKFFTRRLNELAHEQFTMKVGLRQALNRNEFVLYYQPKVDILTGRVSGMESLIRWLHPVKGFTLPGSFIDIAEETGLLTPISKWTINTACRQIQQWQKQGIGPVSVAINLSAKFFEHRDFEDSIETALKETHIAPECLELELTEATLMNNPLIALGNMAAMKALGLQLSIDDFGVGYSCLSYLKKLPVDKLKIDQSFIHHVASDPDDAAVVRAIINIGHSMQKKVIAEGVENVAQLAWLQSASCDEVQGFYFSRPLPPQEITALLRQGPNLLHNPRGRLQARHS